jgi:hypothetical protein
MHPLLTYHKTKAGTRISIGAIGGLVLIALLFAATGNLQNLPAWATRFSQAQRRPGDRFGRESRLERPTKTSDTTLRDSTRVGHSCASLQQCSGSRRGPHVADECRSSRTMPRLLTVVGVSSIGVGERCRAVLRRVRRRSLWLHRLVLGYAIRRNPRGLRE